MKTQNRAALIGSLFALPFIILNFIVSLRLEPFYSFFASFSALRKSIYTPLALSLLLPTGAYIAIRPMLIKGVDGKRPIYIANIIVALVLLVMFALIFRILMHELYECEIVGVPHCD